MDTLKKSQDVDGTKRKDRYSKKRERGVFWTFFWLTWTCIVIVILGLIRWDFIFNAIYRIFPPSRYILWPFKRFLEFGLVWSNIEKQAKKIEEVKMVLEIRKAFCIIYTLLIFANITLGFFFKSVISVFKMKTIDLRKVLMLIVRVSILVILLKGKNEKKMKDNLGPEHVIRFVKAQYFFSSAWSLLENIESITFIEILAEVMGCWVVNVVVSHENQDIVENLLNFPKPVNFAIALVLTPFFYIMIMFYLLELTKRIYPFFRRELEISDEFASSCNIAISVVLIILFIWYAYYELSVVINMLEGKKRNYIIF
ncbi:uncharacterized protein Eint_031210 [Encephalitozoon intestinalis ATCC 50506]|uniref:Uncharacterized protein n=1 Tax=Encephalitozoon intestinalis (strain ATCC 50506) TaxID=876142 RepID=E0S6C8_ENCIT|nr:uncharacterized protein Eint_031210 [Encephalitozoon intestinalis ATCC 50506]ADM11263.1 hypothetical protein Eint_031210 [Encephalitozoon intestinalis ATCC 50506]UTX44931.1 membrane protein [Encephalitozoon intestinalis]